jgi:hypothetical protein
MKEPIRDPRLEDALRSLEGEASMSEADWERLRAAIAARSEITLARLRRGGTWWEFAASWGRAAIPLAAAAGIALATFLPKAAGPGEGSGAPALNRTGLAMVLTGEAPEGEIVQAAISGTDERWLEETVLGEREP